MDTNQTALAGEFFVLAQLSMRGYIGTLTLGHTKGVDILVFSQNSGKLFQLEVKTTKKGPFNTKIFGRNYQWTMDEKHETLIAKNLFYRFVSLNKAEEMPRFFVVPSKVVAEYVTKERAYWLTQPHGKEVKNTNMRKFRIGLNATSHGLQPTHYENKWGCLDR